MATILVCDKCRGHITEPEPSSASGFRKLKIYNYKGILFRELDLCQSCYELIEDIIMNSWKYDIEDSTADDPLKDHCVNTYRSL